MYLHSLEWNVICDEEKYFECHLLEETTKRRGFTT